MAPSVVFTKYSGLPNARWTLDEPQTRQLLALLAGCRRDRVEAAGRLGRSAYDVDFGQPEREADGAESMLVCNGVADLLNGGNNLVDEARAVERFLYESAPDQIRTALPPPSSEVETGNGFNADPRCTGVADADPGRHQPTWNPSAWNVGRQLIWNDCYNYANDLPYDHPRSGKLAAPWAEMPPQAEGAWIQFAERDGLRRVPAASGTPADFDRQRLELRDDEWVVALFVDDHTFDCHWYRQDNTGLWSHKPGGLKARRCDESDNAIRDPRTAATGTYRFAAFFVTGPEVRIAPPG